MRITIVQGAFFPVPTLRGGAVEKVWLALGREFARRGHAVTHISRRCDGLPEREELDGVRHVRVPGFDQPGSSWLLNWRDLVYSRRAARVLPPADILVTNTFWFPLLRHDPSRGRLYVQVGRYPKGQMKFYSRAARLQTVSQAVAAAIMDEAPKLAERVKVIPYPLPEGAWTAQPPGDEAREPLVLYAGRIHPEKGLDLLAAAWTQPRVRAVCAGWKLVLAGPWEVARGGGGENYRAALAAQFAPAAATVEWSGPLFGADTAKLHALYQRARVFVYPSVAEKGESFGLAPLEAMAAGAPCIVSNLACFKDYLREGENGLVFDHRAPDAGERLAQALVALAADPARRARLAAAAWETAGHFRVEEVATRYLNDFESLLTQPTA
jgi:glycosyltransferase involved in cell wall biosynthesis